MKYYSENYFVKTRRIKIEKNADKNFKFQSSITKTLNFSDCENAVLILISKILSWHKGEFEGMSDIFTVFDKRFLEKNEFAYEDVNIIVIWSLSLLKISKRHIYLFTSN